MSLAVAVALLRNALFSSYATYLVIAPTKEQAGFVFKYAYDFLKQNEWLAVFLDSKETRVDEIAFKNGSRIVKRTAGHSGDYLRGISVETGAIVFDEAAYIPDRCVDALLPVCYSAGRVFISTPRFKSGYFYGVCEGELRKLYKRYKVPSWRAPHIPRAAIEEWERSYRPSRYATEVAAEFAQGESAVFDGDAIHAAKSQDLPLYSPGARPPKGDPDKNYVYALDISRLEASRDKTVLTIGEYDTASNHLTVVWYHVWGGPETDDDRCELTNDPNHVIRQIREYAESFHPVRVYVDQTSDPYFGHELLHKHLLPVEPVFWSTVVKERLMEHLGSCFRAGRITIPSDGELIRQLVSFSYDLEKEKSGKERKIYLASDDDYVDSLAMLAQVVTAERKRIPTTIEAW